MQINENKWKKAQKGEAEFWNTFTNTFIEEYKQLFYAHLLQIYPKGILWMNDYHGMKILDIGSNAISLMLKGSNIGRGIVVDPIKIPQWAIDRYKSINIEYMQIKAEDMDFKENEFDEVWIYNCLQHVQNPEIIIKKAMQSAKALRIFEWLGEIENSENAELNKYAKDIHPIVLNEEELNNWIGQKGKTGVVKNNNLSGTYYYGIFVK